MRSLSPFFFFSFGLRRGYAQLGGRENSFILGRWMNGWFMLCFRMWAGGDICPAVGLRVSGLWDTIL